MTFPDRPDTRPNRPNFSSGPCVKHPLWSAESVARRAWLGRSHRAPGPKAQLASVIDDTAALLGMPDDWRLGIVPGSDTGAVEMAMWSLLGARPVDILVWESFGRTWATDAIDHLQLSDARVIEAPYGTLPDLSQVREDADIIFTWNGTTSGARVPDADWISADRKGLAISDATSAAFAQDLDWAKLDVVTFSWQKALGGEGAHGMLALSPRAVLRLESFVPENRPLPKVFRLTRNGALIEGIFRGETINTPSMLCVADWEDTIAWAKGVGLDGLFARADRNFATLQAWIDRSDWLENLVADPAVRSNTSVCMTITDKAVAALDEGGQRDFIRAMAALLEEEGAALDIANHRDAPPGLRVWCGATIETEDIEALTPWLDWAFATTRAELVSA